MTERHEITTILQKELSQIPAVFGELQKGTPENPAVTKESVHHFFKYVAGNPIKRPAWFFDPSPAGRGAGGCVHAPGGSDPVGMFPRTDHRLRNTISKMLNAKRWTTQMTPEQFKKVTRLEPIRII